MSCKLLTSFVALAWLSAAAIAAVPAPEKQAITLQGVEFTIDDTMQWKVTGAGASSFIMSADDKMAILFMPSPIRGCEAVMKKLGGNYSAGDLAPGWYKKGVEKSDSITVCLDMKDQTLLATLSGGVKPKDPMFKHTAILLKELGNALKKK